MARVVCLVRLVASAPKIADSAKFEKDIRKWEEHQTTLAKEVRESFSRTRSRWAS